MAYAASFVHLPKCHDCPALISQAESTLRRDHSLLGSAIIRMQHLDTVSDRSYSAHLAYVANKLQRRCAEEVARQGLNNRREMTSDDSTV
jgi:hypothetical protein